MMKNQKCRLKFFLKKKEAGREEECQEAKNSNKIKIHIGGTKKQTSTIGKKID